MGKKAKPARAPLAAPAVPDADIEIDDGDESMDGGLALADLEELADSAENEDEDEDEDLLNGSADEEDEDDDDDDDADMTLADADADAEATSDPPPTITTTTPLFPTNALPPSSTTHPAIPYVHDAGHLLIHAPSPLPPSPDATTLSLLARDAAQSLLDHLLTTCPIITKSTTSTSSSGVEMQLPAPLFQLPREKAVPAEKQTTKWEAFARKKGIGKYAKPGLNKAGAAPRAGKMVYDEAKGEWVPKWGYKGKNKEGEGDWLVEVDGKDTGKAGRRGKEGGGAGGADGKVVLGVDDPRGMKRAERKEAVRRNEKAQRANDRKARRGK